MVPSFAGAAEATGGSRKHAWLRNTTTALAIGFSLVGGALGLTGCSAQPPPSATLTMAQQGAPLDVMEGTKSPTFLKLQADPMGTRIDVHRERTTTTDAKGAVTTSDVALSDFGVDLGNGLFIDNNENLTFNPYLALKGEPLRGARDVKITEPLEATHTWHRGPEGISLDESGSYGRIHGDKVEGSFLGPGTMQGSRAGNTVKIERGWPSSTWTITQDANKTTIHRGSLQNDWQITREGNTVRIDQGDGYPRTTIRLWQNAAEVQSDSGFRTSWRIEATASSLQATPSSWATSKVQVDESAHAISIHRGWGTQELRAAP